MRTDSLTRPHTKKKMSILVHLLVAVLFTTTTLISLSSAACNPHDKAALLAFKTSFPSTAFPDWTTADPDCCFWSGIRCKKTTGRVKYLILQNNPNISGTLPPSIGDLTELELIKFDTLPNLVGPLPPQFAKLTKLQYFNVYTTGLSGPIPSYFSKFTELFELTFSDCKFEGPIPPSLATLTKLSFLTLTGNKLTGPIPPLFSKLPTNNMPNLDLSNNKLSGPIPPSFGSVSFIYINLMNNQLTGDASFLFGKSKQVFEIHLAHNKLSFDLTHVQFPEKNLSSVDLSHNQIYGNISPQINNSTVGLLDVSYNKLCGKLPTFNEAISNQNDASHFAHNKCLCGKPLPPCK